MKQHITQEQATTIAANFAEDEFYETNICNAAIQHYIDQQAEGLPVLPEPAGRTYHDNALGEEVGQPSDWFHPDQLQAYGAACAVHAREVALEEAREIAWKCTCSDGDDYASAMDRMSAQFAEIAATEPVGAIYTIAGVQHCTITKTVDDTDLFTRPMPAQDVTELVDALEKLARLGNGDRYGNSDGNMIARTALSKYKGAK